MGPLCQCAQLSGFQEFPVPNSCGGPCRIIASPAPSREAWGQDSLAGLRMKGKAHRWQRTGLLNMGGSSLWVQRNLCGQKKAYSKQRRPWRASLPPGGRRQSPGSPSSMQLQNYTTGKCSPGDSVSALCSFYVDFFPVLLSILPQLFLGTHCLSCSGNTKMTQADWVPDPTGVRIKWGRWAPSNTGTNENVFTSWAQWNVRETPGRVGPPWSTGQDQLS